MIFITYCSGLHGVAKYNCLWEPVPQFWVRYFTKSSMSESNLGRLIQILSYATSTWATPVSGDTGVTIHDCMPQREHWLLRTTYLIISSGESNLGTSCSLLFHGRLQPLSRVEKEGLIF